ncbi:MAG: hypothetical protein QOI99_246 [Actinomycetota bacterium]|jgi:hypothetical protein|nr:hypothetical protein [Actinomycetota bacterium]
MGTFEAQVRFAFDETTDFDGALSALALARFVDGSQPYVESFELEGIARAVDLVPVGSVRRQVAGEKWQRVLAEGPGWTVLVMRGTSGWASVRVAAADPELLAKVVADVRSRAPVVEPRPQALSVEFWYQGRCSPTSVRRQLDAPTWESIAAHYTADVRAALGRLMGMAPPAAGGRLLLWHGRPGTGKTTAIRALARSWSAWCSTIYVVDPERFLGSAEYLLAVLLESDDDDDDRDRGGEGPSPRWRLLVLEDADELLRADAKRETGQALSRLLNVADGFLGQGVRVLVLITTNEPIGRLHPAVVRPGRCLAEVEFSPLTAAEGAVFLGTGRGREIEGLTLAELFQRRGDLTRVATTHGAPAPGQYL